LFILSKQAGKEGGGEGQDNMDKRVGAIRWKSDDDTLSLLNQYTIDDVKSFRSTFHRFSVISRGLIELKAFSFSAIQDSFRNHAKL